MQKSIALNVVMYLLLRSASAGEDDEDATANIQAHPVMEQLKKFNSLLQKFEEDVHNKTEGIDNQLDNLVKAAALMAETGNVTSDDESDGSSEDEPDEVEQDNDIEEDRKKESSNSDQDEESVDEEISIGRVKQQEFQRTLNEARFGLRLGEAKEPSRAVQKRRIGDMDDFGDLEEERSTSGSRLLASTVNTIEQRSQVASRKRRQAPLADALDDLDEYDDQVAQGIKMMEEELGKLDDDIEDGEKDNNAVEDMTDPDHHDDETSDFYNVIAQRNKTKKSFKKSLYQVAPKFPRTDNEVAGERAISKTILKNRGLVPHKAKINRNPRAKKRKQYDEAIKRRKGTVREVRRDEGHKYGGEGTGIKSGISRSRKLAIK
jgi:U3 small nucleolar RNA-associated protein 3